MNPSSPAFSLVLMVLLIAMIYFMMIRPQRKKEKADKEMRDALRVGDASVSSKNPNAADKPAAKEAAKEAEEEKAPSRDKKVTPKKLSRKSDDAE